MKLSVILPLLAIVGANGFSSSNFERSSSTTANSRRKFIATSIATTLGLPNLANADIEGVVTPSFQEGAPKISNEEGVKLFTTRSGLKYIVLKESQLPPEQAKSPRFGQLVRISYQSYIKLPNSDLQQYDSDKQYLMKHGNGRIIPGLDEGIHTMKLGETRRIIIPPKLGYVGPGVLGPLPETPWGRYKLNKLLDQMIDVKAGNVVIDVELKAIRDDEADQGYYEDASISPEDFNTLRDNLSAKARNARDARGAVDLTKGAIQ